MMASPPSLSGQAGILSSHRALPETTLPGAQLLGSQVSHLTTKGIEGMAGPEASGDVSSTPPGPTQHTPLPGTGADRCAPLLPEEPPSDDTSPRPKYNVRIQHGHISPRTITAPVLGAQGVTS